MDPLPPAGIRSTLLDALAFIIRCQGYETFVRAPIIEPTSQYFPDPWESTERGVRTLSLRLLAYAGLEDLDATVEIDRSGYDPAEGGKGSRRHVGAAAWFWDICDGTCAFGADRHQLDEADAIVGTMCHEIAHAYRRYHDIESTTRQIDEEQTDITTIYLGFGVLTVNNTQRFRTTGSFQRTGWLMTHAGYLSPQAMAYLFAAQCVARALPPTEVTRLARSLEANQRECFEAAQRELSADVAGLRARLGVPPEEAWPDEVPFDLPELRDDARFTPREVDAVHRAELAQRNVGNGVWRIASTWSVRLAFAIAGVGSIAAWVLVSHQEWSIVAAASAFGAAVGALLGRRVVHYACSDPKCETTIPHDWIEHCPKCGGTFLGTLDEAGDRLEAEEALKENRDVQILRANLAARRAKGSRWALRSLLAAGLVTLGWTALEWLPRPTTIGQLMRNDPEIRRAKLALTGTVLETPVGTVALVSKDGGEILSFRLSDDTGRMAIWYDPSALSPVIHEGDHVRVTGQQFLVDVDGEKRMRFIASTVKRLP
jgi:hypothetical protein